MRLWATPSEPVLKILGESAFLKFGLPILTIVALVVLIFFGLKGIIKQNTINLVHPRWIGMGSVFNPSEISTHVGHITGIWAVIFGLCYLGLAVLLAAILGPLSWELLKRWLF